MKQSKLLIIAVAIVALVVLAAAFTGHLPGMMNHSMGRHMQGMMRDVPEPYSGMTNPLPATAEVVARGAALFKANCSACHGAEGRGDGPAGESLSPRPSDLTHILQMPFARDDYLFWTISEGGKRFGTAMPTFDSVLDEQARWQIVHYLKTL